MQIIVHRGTDQIGGCATEIRTASTRILIDFGAELPDKNREKKKENIKIKGLNFEDPDFSAVFLTHYHEDHIGLINQIPDSIPIFLGRNAKIVLDIYANKRNNSLINKVKSIIPLDSLQPINVGNITVTPIPADHSAYDAFMFLVEAEDQRVLHTGDFRLHGFRGKATPKLLGKFAENIDLIIMEGTNLSRNSQSIDSEYELQMKIKEEVFNNKYVFVLCASTNIDRLASFYNATPRGRYFVCDKYQKQILDGVSSSSDSRWYKFSKTKEYGENLIQRFNQRGFVMIVRANDAFKNIMDSYQQSVLIYSMWDGYLEGLIKKQPEFIKPFIESDRIKYLHSSGHATLDDIFKVCSVVKPKKGAVFIHTGSSKNLGGLVLSCPVIELEDKEVYTI